MDNTKKRKTISDFFSPSPKRVASTPKPPIQQEPTPSNLSVAKTAVLGVTLHFSFVTPVEESLLLTYLNSPVCKWRTDLSRRTMHFGGTYCIMPPCGAPPTKPEILQAPHIPSELFFLIDRMVEQGIYRKDQRPQYCIVNEYTGALGISAHTENFSFGEPVVGLSLLYPDNLRFRELVKAENGSVRSGKAAKLEKTGNVVDVQLPGRSLVVMMGEGRYMAKPRSVGALADFSQVEMAT